MDSAAADGHSGPFAATGEPDHGGQASDTAQQHQVAQQRQEHNAVLQQSGRPPGAAAAVGGDAQHGSALDNLAAVAAVAGQHFLSEQQHQLPAEQSMQPQHSAEPAAKKPKRTRNLNVGFSGPDAAAGQLFSTAEAEDEAAAAAPTAVAAAPRRSGSSGSRQHSGSGAGAAAATASQPQQWKRARYSSGEMNPTQFHFQQAQQFKLQQEQQMLQAAAQQVKSEGLVNGELGDTQQQQMLTDNHAQQAGQAAGAAAGGSEGGRPGSLQQSLQERLQQLLLPELGKQAILQSLDPACQCMVECGSATGIFSVDSERILCLCTSCSAGKGPPGPEFMPSEFERHGGMAACKKWRFSIKVADGGPGMTLGRWLDMRGIQISSNPTKSRNLAARLKRPLDTSKSILSAGSSGGPTIQLDVSQLLAGLVSGNNQLSDALRGMVTGGAAAASSSAAAAAATAGGGQGSSPAGSSSTAGPGDLAALLGSSAGSSATRLNELAAAVADMLVKELPAATTVAAAAPGLPASGLGAADEPSGAAVSLGVPAITTATCTWPDTAMTAGTGSDDVPLGYAIAAQVASGLPVAPVLRQELQQLQQRSTVPPRYGSGTELGLLGLPNTQSATHTVRLPERSLGPHGSRLGLLQHHTGQVVLQPGNSVQHSSSSSIMQLLQRQQQQAAMTLLPPTVQPIEQQQQQHLSLNSTALPVAAGAGGYPGGPGGLPPAGAGHTGLQLRRSSSTSSREAGTGRGAAGGSVLGPGAAGGPGPHTARPGGHASGLQGPAPATGAGAGPPHSNAVSVEQQLADTLLDQSRAPFHQQAGLQPLMQHALSQHQQSAATAGAADAGIAAGGELQRPASTAATVDSGGSAGRAAAAAAEAGAVTPAGRLTDADGHAALRDPTDSDVGGFGDPYQLSRLIGLSPESGSQAGCRPSAAAQAGTIGHQYDAEQFVSTGQGQPPAAAAAASGGGVLGTAAAGAGGAEASVDWQRLIGSLENRLDVLLEDRRRRKQLEEQLIVLQAELAEERRRRLTAEQKLATLSTLLLDKLESAHDNSSSPSHPAAVAALGDGAAAGAAQRAVQTHPLDDAAGARQASSGHELGGNKAMSSVAAQAPQNSTAAVPAAAVAASATAGLQDAVAAQLAVPPAGDALAATAIDAAAGASTVPEAAGTGSALAAALGSEEPAEPHQQGANAVQPGKTGQGGAALSAFNR